MRHTFVNLFSNPDIMRVNQVLPYPRVLTIHVHGNLKQFDCIRMLSKNYRINYMDPLRYKNGVTCVFNGPEICILYNLMHVFHS